MDSTDFRFLQDGAVFVKHPAKGGTSAKRMVFLKRDPDGDKKSAIYWCKGVQKVEQRDKCILLEEILSVSIPANLKGQSVSPNLRGLANAFTIQGADRSLDLQSETEDLMLKWVGGLRLLQLIRAGIKESSPPAGVKLPKGYVLCSNGSVYDAGKQWRCIGKLVKKDEPKDSRVDSSRRGSKESDDTSTASAVYTTRESTQTSKGTIDSLFPSESATLKILEEKDRQIEDLQAQVRKLQQLLVTQSSGLITPKPGAEPPKGSFTSATFDELDQEYHFVYRQSLDTPRCGQSGCQGVVKEGFCASHAFHRPSFVQSPKDKEKGKGQNGVPSDSA